MSWSTPPGRTESIIAHPDDLASLRARGLVGYTVNDVLCVYAVQRAMNDVAGREALTLDGAFGPRTREAVKLYQSHRAMVADGIFGPETSARAVRGFLKPAAALSGTPDGLPDGQVHAESGDLFGAVNTSSPGGVDLSAVQRRVLGPPYDPGALERAFDVRYQVGLLCGALRERYDTFLPRAGVQAPKVLAYIPTKQERAWRLAALWHNYQTAADNYSRYPDHRSSYWTTPQEWVVEHGYEFDDGAPVRTPWDWARFYAVGAPEHGEPGLVCERVVDWSP